MNRSPHIAFVLNLLQDVNVLRPLVFIASRDLGLRADILVSARFGERDTTGSWRAEIAEIAQAAGAFVSYFESTSHALMILDGRGGALVAGSESNLSAHAPVHELFRLAGPAYRKLTIQHGLECVGMLQSRDHDKAFGTDVRFGADVVCGWSDGSVLSSMLPSERPKLVTTGPTAVLQQPRRGEAPSPPVGLVCENLHSARFKMAGDFRGGFLEVFEAFCAALGEEGRSVVLRPHPGGQYTLRNATALPRNVRVNNHPMYKIDLARYAYGISAPSSVLIDMVLAGVPTAVWRDADGMMDAGNYAGLAEVSDGKDWLAFSREAEAHPERFREAQAAYLGRFRMPTDPAFVARRFAELFRAAVAAARAAPVRTGADDGCERVLFVANGNIPSLQISFERPLAGLVAEGRARTLLIDDLSAGRKFPKGQHAQAPGRDWVRREFAAFKPTAVVFCRYSGAYHELILELARTRGVATIMHVDDDLLGIPENFGEAKYRFHNDPARLKAVRDLLEQSDLVYCSTPKLKDRMAERGIENEMRAGRIYCPGVVIQRPAMRPMRRIGYTGFREKLPELELVLPAIERFMEARPEIQLDLIGDIPLPPSLQRFGERVSCQPPVRDYGSFLMVLAAREWDVGICPLEATPFNMVKADTKWVEYTAIGAAVVASRGTVYDTCCADGCGLLADGEDEWLAAFEQLAADPQQRFGQVERAQAKLETSYSPAALTEQVVAMIEEAKVIGRARRADGVNAAQSRTPLDSDQNLVEQF